MIGILKYKLPEEEEQFRGAQKAHDFYRCLWDMDTYLHDVYKHVNPEDAPDVGIVFKEFRDILEDHGVTLEEYS